MTFYGYKWFDGKCRCYWWILMEYFGVYMGMWGLMGYIGTFIEVRVVMNVDVWWRLMACRGKCWQFHGERWDLNGENLGLFWKTLGLWWWMLVSLQPMLIVTSWWGFSPTGACLIVLSIFYSFSAR